MARCKICGEENCKEHQFILNKRNLKKEFSGSSPPEIFVGRWNYPNVYTGILAPEEYGDTTLLSSPEEWHSQKLSIPTITSLRNKLIYGRTQGNVKQTANKFTQVMQEVAMTEKSIAAEFKLKKAISSEKHPDPRVPLISRAAAVERVRLQENTSVKPKVDYLVNDKEVKSVEAMKELYTSKIPVSTIMKLLSAGLLGMKNNRRLVPTRWSITAVDDTLSRNKLEKIRYNQEISEFLVFNAEYLGNHYEFLLLPAKYSFEVIEIMSQSLAIWKDHETFFPRKKYADEVTGAYYANRLALTEYLEKAQRQATCIVMREVKPEYNAPCGVGILRETSREAFAKKPKSFSTLKEALKDIQSRITIPVEKFTSNSIILKEFGKQKRITDFFIKQ